eukprot:352932-Chlamydomonas_euryale.AAC.11
MHMTDLAADLSTAPVGASGELLCDLRGLTKWQSPGRVSRTGVGTLPQHECQPRGSPLSWQGAG